MDAAMLTNEICIRSDAASVYSLCISVERWPEMFPTVLAVSVEPAGDDAVLMKMTSQSDLGVTTIRSRRRYRPERHAIDFELLTVPPQVGSMTGWWRIDQTDDAATVRVEVVHLITVSPDTPTHEHDRQLEMIKASVYKNTQQALEVIKQRVERVAAGVEHA